MKSLTALTTPYGWLQCNSTARTETDYPDLYAILPSSMKNTTNHTFVVDLREVELIGSGQSSRGDIGTHDSISLGSYRADQLQNHYHTVTDTGDVAWVDPKGSIGGGKPWTMTTAVFNTSGVLGATAGTTTHGKQVGVNYIIKAMP